MKLMKTIKIKFVGFWENFDEYEKLDIYKILKKHYDVKICDDADYIICSCFGEPYDFLKYPQIRILLTEENFTPDFNYFDYAICPYPIEFLDRSFWYPTCVKPLCAFDYDHAVKLETKKRKYDNAFLDTKEYFANFIYSHESDDGVRGAFFGNYQNIKGSSHLVFI